MILQIFSLQISSKKVGRFWHKMKQFMHKILNHNIGNLANRQYFLANHGQNNKIYNIDPG
jgi:hypothetical protein